jgi:hypothetical protein
LAAESDDLYEDDIDEDEDGDEGRLWAAQPRQDLVLTTFADVDDAGFGGAAGGGKTDFLTIFHATRRQTYPGSKGLIARLSFTDLSKSGANIDRFLELFGKQVKYDGNEHKAYWRNGSVTEFGYCASKLDLQHYQTAQYDDLCVDELTQWPEEWFTYLKARVRVRKKRLAKMGMKPLTRTTFNPGGIGHAWVKKRYVDLGDCTPAVVSLGEGFTETRVFVQSKVDDNEDLLESDPTYKARLSGISDEQTRKAMLHGDWNIFEGQVFREWREDVHVIDVVVPPKHWDRVYGFDWGWASPWVLTKLAIDRDTGQIVQYGERVGVRMTDTEIAEAIIREVRHDGVEPYAIYADPSIWNKRADGYSTAERMEQVEGWAFNLEPADNDRLNGLRRFHDALAWKDDFEGSVVQSPQLVFTRNCKETIRTLPMLIHDEINVEDVHRKAEDHEYDSIRYALMGIGDNLIDAGEAGVLVYHQ